LKRQPESNTEPRDVRGSATKGDSGYIAISPPTVNFVASQISPMEALFWMGGGDGAAASEGDSQTKARREAAQGDALIARGQFHAALTHFHEAVWLCPDSPEFHYRLASAAEKADRLDLLEKHLLTAVRLEPCFAPAHYALGTYYRLEGKPDRGLFHTSTCVALAPREPRYVCEHGILLLMTAQTQAAWELIEDLVTQPGPANLRIAYLYARLAPMVGHEEKALEYVERALQNGNLTSARDSRPMLQFAASSLLDGLGRYDQAFKHAHDANESIRASSTYDPAIQTELITRRINYFSANRLKSLPRATHGNRRPVFIVGMPRSGTSLVEQILASHPDVYAAGELEALGKLPTARELTERLPGEAYPQSLELLSTRSANLLASRYLSAIEELNIDARYVTDKMPCNFLFLELVELLFPGCRVIHCVRNPLDTCLSCFMTSFSLAHDFKLDLTSLGAYHRDYRRLMDHWKQVLTVPLFELRYEDLVLDTECQVRQLLEFLDLPWNEECLTFHKNKRAVKTASEDQVRKPIYTSSIGRWKHYEARLGPLFASLRKPSVGGIAAGFSDKVSVSHLNAPQADGRKSKLGSTPCGCSGSA